ncbi:hypothetical protein NEOC65_001482 [Neochlamydia sp. AcF65]|nr:hypothetical protein [Neochlamydia sp. AcF65]MBS4169350.1 hypothetical protein [Neochlamydia sp. AcF95]
MKIALSFNFISYDLLSSVAFNAKTFNPFLILLINFGEKN